MDGSGYIVGGVSGLAAGFLLAGAAAVAWARRIRLQAESLRRETAESQAQAAESARLAELGLLTAGLAHEIKNPLSTLRLNLQLLREDLDPARATSVDLPRASRRLTGVAAEAERLGYILDDFLRYAGRLEVDSSPVDVAGVVAELVDFLHPQARAAGVRLVPDLPPAGVPGRRVDVDARLVKQAVLNLVLNAMQHSPPDGQVLLRVVPEADAVRVEVVDAGPGIAPEDLTRIFTPYFSRRKGGTGLGLAMTRRIADAHGGRVDAESVPGQGSRFSLVLPVNPVGAADVRRRGA